METKRIQTKDLSDEDKFREEVNSYLGAGGKLLSCSSGVVNSEAYDFCSWWHAIIEV